VSIRHPVSSNVRNDCTVNINRKARVLSAVFCRCWADGAIYGRHVIREPSADEYNLATEGMDSQCLGWMAPSWYNIFGIVFDLEHLRRFCEGRHDVHVRSELVLRMAIYGGWLRISANKRARAWYFATNEWFMSCCSWVGSVTY
ncbi:unnamed protein product, partial [Sphacelaria rigidula]